MKEVGQEAQVLPRIWGLLRIPYLHITEGQDKQEWKRRAFFDKETEIKQGGVFKTTSDWAGPSRLPSVTGGHLCSVSHNLVLSRPLDIP